MSKIEIQPITKNMSEQNRNTVTTADAKPNPDAQEPELNAKVQQFPETSPVPYKMASLSNISVANPEICEGLVSDAEVLEPGTCPAPKAKTRSKSSPKPKATLSKQRKAKATDAVTETIVVDEVVLDAICGELSTEDLAYRESRETIVDAGVNACITAGRALFEIKNYHEGALWRSGHKSFDMYCQAKWNLHKSHAYRLVDTGELVIELETEFSPRGENLPVNEGQVRPLLANVPKERRVECWKEIVNGKMPAELSSTAVGAGVQKYLLENGLPTKASKPSKTAELPAKTEEQPTKENDVDLVLRRVQELLKLAAEPTADVPGLPPHEIKLTISQKSRSKELQIITIHSAIHSLDPVLN